ncbi:MAG: rod shape-determining protein, partial [Hyphomicrobiales bacterium]|nr:rod shape-determining protein [Hyphomicrobiales bacterium]
RCHLGVEALVAAPYAAGLATLTEDEAELGAAVVDFGAGTTSVGVFQGGRLGHVDAVAVGGLHVTMDVARGLGVPMAEAERLKTLHGGIAASASDERDMIALEGGTEDGPPQYVARAQLVRIVRPRVEEILELVRDRLTKAGFAAQAGRRVVLTGGGSQLAGLADLARTYLSGDARIGRPTGVDGLPEAARSPAFAAAAGLVAYPQAAGLEHFEPSRGRDAGGLAGDGYVARVGRWLRESF